MKEQILDSRDIALGEFLDETSEMIERIAQNLAKIEAGDHSIEIIHDIYRDFHSLKGNAALYGCIQMGEISHVLESSIDPVRRGAGTLSSTGIDHIYEGLDLIKFLRDGVARNKKEPDFQDKLSRLIPKIAAYTSDMFEGEINVWKDSSGIQDHLAKERQALASYDASPREKRTEIQEALPKKAADPPASTIQKTKPNSARDGSQKQKEHSPSTSRTGGAVDKSKEKAAASADVKQPETIRVQVGILDKLMNLVGELVLVRNQHLQNETKKGGQTDTSLSQRLNLVTGELQEEVMKTRMQPIGTILTKYQRVVRDLSNELGKRVALIIEGNETELDKTLLEAVKDPLMHIVRNSVDHGLESPEDREAVGKSPEGRVKIKAYHEGGQVVVEIEDDGRGLNREKIANKAVEKGLATVEKIRNLPDRDVFMFIFSPGFSTAEKISNVSGRGVGMDVVRTNIEHIGGMIDLSSREGKGTTIRLKIPLTLAIIPAIIVRSGGERFAIPQVNLVELVRLERDENNRAAGVETLQDQPVYRLRGQLLPLVELNKVLSLPMDMGDPDSENIVVLNADSGTFGLVVDGIDDSADIVVKPLMQFLKDQTVYSGATVLGDGSVALTIDVVALANRVGILSPLDEEHRYNETGISEETSVDHADYLLVDIGAESKYAVPLCLVNRLEEFESGRVEITGEQRVLQYRNSLLPIISVSSFLKLGRDHLGHNENSDTGPTSCAIIVIQKGEKLFGLEVTDIVDVVTVDSEVDTELVDRRGILGTMVVHSEVVVLLDVFSVVDELHSKMHVTHFDSSDNPRSPNQAPLSGTVLVAEDNAFFRKQIESILNQLGINVVLAVNGEEALKTLDSYTNEISMVLSDIEMPVMNGLELAEKIRGNEKYKDLPLVALTTMFRKKDIEQGYKAGFTKYLEKLNPEELVKEVTKVMGDTTGRGSDQ